MSKIGIMGLLSFFEVCHESDPHIVDDKQGVHYLGIRENTADSKFLPIMSDVESFLAIKTLRDAIEYCTVDRGEGFMLYDELGNCCKLKTDYYIGKKKLMRMPKSKIPAMWNNPKLFQDSLPTCWNDVVEYILYTQEQESWLEMTDQQRRKELEKFV